MANRTVTIRISAQDSFSDVMRRYQQQIGQAEQATQRVGQTAQRQGGLFRALGTEIQGALAGVTIGASIQAIGALNDLGMQGRQTGAIFKQMMSELGVSAENMRTRLRNATGGVVDDLSLMGGANLIQRLGLTDTDEELESLIGNIIRLKQPTDDVTTAVSNFGLMISNQSLLRLDSFGLSSQRVKERMEELQETLGREEAFKLAVFEEMNTQVERLGPAAEAGMTAFGRLGTQIQNTLQGAGNIVAQGLEAGAQLILIGERVIENVIEPIADASQAASEETRRQLEEARDVAEELARLREASEPEPLTPTPLELNVGGNLITTMSNPTETFRLIERAIQEYEDAYGVAAQTTEDVMRGLRQTQLVDETFVPSLEFLDAINFALERREDAEENIARLLTIQQQSLASMAFSDFNRLEAGMEARRRLLEQNAQVDPLDLIWQENFIASQERVRMLQAAAREDQRAYIDAFDPVDMAWRDNFIATQQQMGAAQNAAQLEGIVRDMQSMFPAGAQFATAGMAQEADALADDAERIYGALQSAAETDAIPQITLDRAESAADAARRMADDMARAEENARNMSLRGALGVNPDNQNRLLGEGTDAFLGYLRDQGYADEDLQPLQDILDLTSGRETELSQYFEDTALPAFETLFAEYGKETAATAYTSFLEGLRTAQAMGLNPADPFLLSGFVRLGEGGDSYTVQPGDSWSRIASERGISVAEAQRQAGRGGMLHPNQVLNFGGGGGVMPLSGIPSDYQGRVMGGAFGEGGQVPDLTPVETSMQNIRDYSSEFRVNWGEAAATEIPAVNTGLETTVGRFDKVNNAVLSVDERMPAVATETKRVAGFAESVSEKFALARDYVKEIAKTHTITFDTRVRYDGPVPAWFDDMFNRKLARVMEINGGAMPGDTRR